MAAVVTPFPSRPRAGKSEPAAVLPAGRDARYAAGKALRQHVPREKHGEWKPPRNRRDPVQLVMESSKGRLPELIPIRYGRMMVSPFTFYRGTANIMAADLASTPVSGVQTQICGDCHLLNFGAVATPERRLILDINVFDQTLPGPWEWDVKRLAASFVFAARSNGFSAADQREAALACVRSYREHMVEYADMPVLDVWYARLEMSETLATVHDKAAKSRLKKRIKKAESQTVSEHEFPKMAETRGGRYLIKDTPPLIYHHPTFNMGTARENVQSAFRRYRDSLPDDRRALLDRYQFMDIALKVGGVGGVGTRCAIGLMMGVNDAPMFLQIKEAGPCVLEDYRRKSSYANHCRR